MNYGKALMAHGDFAKARECYERAATLTPNDWTLEINRGIVEGSLGNPKAAEAHFRRAIELGPGQPDVYFYYARWLLQAGRGPEAVEHLRTALRLSPAAVNALSLLTDRPAASGDAAGAAELARPVVAADPGNARARAFAKGRSPVLLGTADRVAYMNHGLKLAQSGNDVESVIAYRAAIAIDPGYVDALNNLGFELGKLGFFAEAVPFLEKAVAIRPDFTLARNNLAWVKSRVR